MERGLGTPAPRADTTLVRPQVPRANAAVEPLKRAGAAVGSAISETAGRYTDAAGLYAPQNARDVGVNLRRGVGAAAAIPVAATEMATRSMRALAGASMDQYRGLLTPGRGRRGPVVFRLSRLLERHRTAWSGRASGRQ